MGGVIIRKSVLGVFRSAHSRAIERVLLRSAHSWAIERVLLRSAHSDGGQIEGRQNGGDFDGGDRLTCQDG